MNFNVISINGWTFQRRDWKTFTDRYVNARTGETATALTAFDRQHGPQLIGYNVKSNDGKQLRFQRSLV